MLHTSQLNGAIERIFSAIKVGALEMLLNAKLNDTAHRILWVEAFYVWKHVRNSMATTDSFKSSLESFYGEKLKIVGSFSEFWRIGHATKQDKFKNQTTDKFFKEIMVGYLDKHTRATLKL